MSNGQRSFKESRAMKVLGLGCGAETRWMGKLKRELGTLPFAFPVAFLFTLLVRSVGWAEPECGYMCGVLRTSGLHSTAVQRTRRCLVPLICAPEFVIRLGLRLGFNLQGAVGLLFIRPMEGIRANGTPRHSVF